MNFKNELISLENFPENSILIINKSYIEEIFNFLKKSIEIELKETNDKEKIFKLGKLDSMINNYIEQVNSYLKNYEKLKMSYLDIKNLLEACIFIEKK